MWDHVPASQPHHLPHDPACPTCGHAAHTYLPCSDTCTCTPPPMPGTVRLAA